MGTSPSSYIVVPPAPGCKGKIVGTLVINRRIKAIPIDQNGYSSTACVDLFIYCCQRQPSNQLLREVVLWNFASKAEFHLLATSSVGPENIFRCDMGLAFCIGPRHALLP